MERTTVERYISFPEESNYSELIEKRTKAFDPHSKY